MSAEILILALSVEIFPGTIIYASPILGIFSAKGIEKFSPPSTDKNIEILSVFIGALLVFATSQIIFWLDPDFQTISFESFDIILNGPAVAVTKIFFTSWEICPIPLGFDSLLSLTVTPHVRVLSTFDTVSQDEKRLGFDGAKFPFKTSGIFGINLILFSDGGTDLFTLPVRRLGPKLDVSTCPESSCSQQ